MHKSLKQSISGCAFFFFSLCTHIPDSKTQRGIEDVYLTLVQLDQIKVELCSTVLGWNWLPLVRWIWRSLCFAEM